MHPIAQSPLLARVLLAMTIALGTAAATAWALAAPHLAHDTACDRIHEFATVLEDLPSTQVEEPTSVDPMFETHVSVHDDIDDIDVCFCDEPTTCTPIAALQCSLDI